jgi:hypothetical protein
VRLVFVNKARSFVGLIVLLFFALPMGLSVTGCGHKAAPVVYCNAGDSGPVVGQVATITLASSLATTGESLNYGQMGAALSASAAKATPFRSGLTPTPAPAAFKRTPTVGPSSPTSIRPTAKFAAAPGTATLAAASRITPPAPPLVLSPPSFLLTLPPPRVARPATLSRSTCTLWLQALYLVGLRPTAPSILAPIAAPTTLSALRLLRQLAWLTVPNASRRPRLVNW